MTSPEALRVLVVEDHPVFRRGVVGVLAEAPGIEVVGELDDGDVDAVVEEVGRTAADLVLMDLHLPGTDGIEATAAVRDRCPGVRVLVLTMRADDDALFAAMRAGAGGFLVKGATGEQIVAACRAVAAGEVLFGAEVSERVLATLRSPGTTHPRLGALSQREREVLHLVAAGKRNADIALGLSLSEKTVRNHVSSIFVKLGVATRSEAIVVGRDAGLGVGR